ncbi:fatty acyl-AMP ligase [Actinokineospora sp. NBRC 105648]|uniref:fatty acyl-AMP ligase n=1 Tax=Actinokineospora sp. NBRC 105648 TaxID=3032206 RepID=UPI0024A29A92|nr:fatty acyl-AMP ligase [Actinokineospora sp. NBRC 105648]GLZ41077.1 AMP-binding protein [Actinokineospora sp. NBRC 105648]
MAGSGSAEQLFSTFRKRVVDNPDDPAVTFVSDLVDSPDYSALSYSELDSRARRVASWLAERFAPGERALLLYPPGVEFAVGFFACVYAGLVAVPAPVPGRYRHERRRLAGIAADARVCVLLTSEDAVAAVSAWAAEEGVSAVCHPSDSAAGDPAAWREPAVTPESVALLQYTSGSTGRPRGVRVRHRNLLSNVDAICAAFGFGRAQRYGSWIPLHHDMGLIGMLLPGVLRGRGYVQMDPVAFLRRPHHWPLLLDRFDVNATAAPDFGYDLCARRVTDEQVAGLDLSRLHGAVSGAEPVRADTVARFLARFAPAGLRPEVLVPMYGLAEATLMVTGTARRAPVRTALDRAALEQRELRPAASGAARDLVGCGAPRAGELLIVDPDNAEPLPQGRIGEIWLRGPGVAGGYWDDPEATARTFGARLADGRGPFLRTGDLGGLLDGDLYVTGRRKDTLVLHGRNLHPQDIEGELRERHTELDGLHGAVFTVGGHDGATGPDTGEVVVLVHEIRGHWGPDHLAAVAAAMKQTVAREFGVPVGAVALVRPGAVRRTTSGKVERSATRHLYLSGQLDVLLLSEDPLVAAALGPLREVSV